MATTFLQDCLSRAQHKANEQRKKAVDFFTEWARGLIESAAKEGGTSVAIDLRKVPRSFIVSTMSVPYKMSTDVLSYNERLETLTELVGPTEGLPGSKYVRVLRW